MPVSFPHILGRRPTTLLAADSDPRPCPRPCPGPHVHPSANVHIHAYPHVPICPTLPALPPRVVDLQPPNLSSSSHFAQCN